MARPRAHLDTDALVRAFAPDGLHGTSLEQLARAARLAKPTLYQRGGDKEELFALAVEAEVERLVERLDAARRSGRGLQGAATALDGYLRERPHGARLLFLTAHHTRSRVTVRVERALARIPSALEADHPPALAGALLGGAVGALRGGPPVSALAELLARTAPAPDAPPAELWTA